MTQEEIKKLAKEYAHIRVFDGGFFDKEEEVVEYDFALPVIQWLLENYCIVPKSEITKLNIVNRITDYNVVILNRDNIEALFGKELFNESEE